MTKILISPGYGAGWSSWNDIEYTEFLVKDPILVEMAERKASREEVEGYVKSTLNDDSVFLAGWNNIEVIEVPKGVQFRVKEHEGNESLLYAVETKWITA